jgi:O-antigen/teichoic acid export membrane protein
MKQRLFEFLKRKTSIDVIINSIGNLINVFFIALLALIVVRVMKPVEYGVLSVLLGLIYVVSNILDFGVSANIYSSVPNLIGKSRKQTFSFLKGNFIYQTSLSLFVLILLYIFFPFIDKNFLKIGGSQFVLFLSTFSIILLIWKNFIINVLLATKKILQVNIANILANLGITLILFILVFYNSVTVSSVIFVYVVLNPILFFLFLIPGKKDYFKELMQAKINKDDFKFKYSFTYFLSTQVFNLGSRMDLFLLSFYGLKVGVGLFGLSQKIILTILTTVVSVTQILSPDFARVKNKKQAFHMFKTSFVYLLIPTGIYLFLLITPNQVFSFMFTKEYAETALITKSLVIPYVLFTLTNIGTLFLLYSVRKPGYLFTSSMIYLIGMTLGCFFFIPKLGVYAPSYVASISIFLGMLIFIYATFKEYGKLPK